MPDKGTASWSIVLGVDDSPASAHAIRWVARLAAQLGARVTMITATSRTSEVINDSLPMGFADWRQRLRRQLHDEWARPLQEMHVEYRTRLVEKTPGTALLAVAAEENADLIAIGTHRHHWVPGSLSSYLSPHASCPVVAVPFPGAPPESAGDPSASSSIFPVDDPATDAPV